MAIRPDPEPKSASPRSGAPKGELEQYGVWVKAEPQDVIEEVAVPGAGDLDFDIPGDSASLPEESFLSEDEEKLLSSFDTEFEIPSESTAKEPGPLPDIEENSPGNIYISLQDSENARTDSPIHPGVEIDMDSVEGFGIPLPAEESHSGTIEDVSSKSLELAEEPKPELNGREGPVSDFGSDLDDVTAEFLDADRQLYDSASKGMGGLDQSSSSTEAGFEAVTEFDDFLTTEEVKAPTPDEGFDDVSAVERELSAPSIEDSPITRPNKEAERSDISADILLKIAQELSSIRGELVSLKAQIGEILISTEPAAAKAAEATIEEVEEESTSGGFFDEEEDETIALTGDELDNILNTADFTEEIAQTEESVSFDLDSSIPLQPSSETTDLLDETLLPESGDYSSLGDYASPGDYLSPKAKPAIEEVRLGEADEIDQIGIETQGPESDELSLVNEEGVMPLTQAPDDTSYLGTSESIDLGAPLNDEPLISGESLVEPNLSDFDLEPEDMEPQLEIIEELPLAGLEPEVKDITLGINAGLGYTTEESVVEAEFLEPIQEIEEPNFAEINLHEEELEPQSSTEPSEIEEIEFLPDADLNASLAPLSPSLPITAPKFEEEEDLILAAEEEALPSPPPPAKSEPIHHAETKAHAPQSSASIEKAPEPPVSNDGDRLKSEIKSVLSYLDKLLDSLPEEKIEEFARSEYFDTYKKLFEELGLV
jgi:pilus assembly protein FimV